MFHFFFFYLFVFFYFNSVIRRGSKVHYSAYFLSLSFFLFFFLLTITIIISIIIIVQSNFAYQRKQMVFHWSLTDSISPQVSRTFLIILPDLNNTVGFVCLLFFLFSFFLTITKSGLLARIKGSFDYYFVIILGLGNTKFSFIAIAPSGKLFVLWKIVSFISIRSGFNTTI